MGALASLCHVIRGGHVASDRGLTRRPLPCIRCTTGDVACRGKGAVPASLGGLVVKAMRPAHTQHVNISVTHANSLVRPHAVPCAHAFMGA